MALDVTIAQMTSPRGSTRGLLVTGGTSGIGLAIALRLSRTHAPVYLVSRRARSAAQATFEAFDAQNLARPELVDVDVSAREALAEVASEIREAGVDIGTVVTSAGIAVRGLAVDVRDEDVRSMLDVNLYGTIATFLEFAPLVLSGPHGRFIAISSMSAVHGQKLRAVYAATKAGVSGLVRALAAEWSPQGATVNAIGPGILRTALTQPYMEANPERAAAAVSHSLTGDLGTVEDVAFTAEYLAAPENGYMTGQTIVLDGGVTAGSTWW